MSGLSETSAAIIKEHLRVLKQQSSTCAQYLKRYSQQKEEIDKKIAALERDLFMSLGE